MNELNAIGAVIAELEALTSAMNNQIAELKEAATEYAEAVHYAKKRNERYPDFSGSDERKRLDAIVRSLQGAHRTVGMIGLDAIRSGS